MSFYGEMATVADDLLREFGQAITISRQVSGEYDPETGSSSVTVTNETGTGAVFDFSGNGTHFAPDSLLMAGDKQLLLSPIGITKPFPGCLAVFAGETWNVVSIKTTAPAGVAVLYECQLRK